jgi:hypothetical protein
MDNWQPIETAPKDGTKIDLWHKDGYRVADCRWDIKTKLWFTDGPFPDDSDVTHWMPLPAAPAAQKAGA